MSTSLDAMLDAEPVTRTVRRPSPPPPRHRLPSRWRRLPWAVLGLLVVVLGQVLFALTRGENQSPFEDEGLYVYIGHRMIEHLLHGSVLTEYPGAFFSGAPAFYPVLAALGDHVDGLAGARDVSLLFAVIATVAVWGIGRELYGQVAAVLGSAAFVLVGSVEYIGHFATYDSTMMAFIALAAWVTVHSVRRHNFRLASVVSVLLVAAFYAKYAGAAYLPVTALLALAVAAPRHRLTVLRRTVFMVLATVTLAYVIYVLWGRSLLAGIEVTTSSRSVLHYQPRAELISSIQHWVGAWLILAVLGALVTPRKYLVSIALLVGAVIGPVEQVRIGESTSLSKHVAFGMVYASPLIGALFARILRTRVRRARLGLLAVPLVGAVFVQLALTGYHTSRGFLDNWVPDAPLLPVLTKYVEANPGLHILGEEPSSERYALRSITNPAQWDDTFYLSYGHHTENAAYKEAIDQTAFGVIYLARQTYAGNVTASTTTHGRFVYDYLTSHRTPYVLAATVPRTFNGQRAGMWLIYVRRGVPARHPAAATTDATPPTSAPASPTAAAAAHPTPLLPTGTVLTLRPTTGPG